MEQYDLFRDVAERTAGDVYLGVVGPVRTGKSTLIRRLMELVVLPGIEDENERERARDAVPQSGSGPRIMTSEPKFVPDDGVMVRMADDVAFRIRLVDCVGYTVPGAEGYEDDGEPRLVDSPWFEEKVPFQVAAEVGTEKVIQDHATVGFVVTTDGSFGEIPREAFVEAEERVIDELKAIGKPFIVLLNSAEADRPEARDLASSLEAKYGVPCLPVNGPLVTSEDISHMLEELLYEFPVNDFTVSPPEWVTCLEPHHELREAYDAQIAGVEKDVRKVRDVSSAVEALSGANLVKTAYLSDLNLGTGMAKVTIEAPEGLFTKTLSDLYGADVSTEAGMMAAWTTLVRAKRHYDKVASAMEEVQRIGYGLVPPSIEEMNFEAPEIIRQGSRFGVRLKAGAPSIHMIRADIATEVTPIIGTEKQSEELMQYLLDRFEDDPALLWQSDLFGKSLQDLAREGIQNKLVHMPENVRMKIQETVERVVNEGSAGLICIII